MLTTRADMDNSIRFGIAQSDSGLIDAINILQATHRAMNEALAQLSPPPEQCLQIADTFQSFQIARTPTIGNCVMCPEEKRQRRHERRATNDGCADSDSCNGHAEEIARRRCRLSGASVYSSF